MTRKTERKKTDKTEAAPTYRQQVNDARRAIVLDAIERHTTITAAARALGMDRPNLRTLLVRLGLRTPQACTRVPKERKSG